MAILILNPLSKWYTITTYFKDEVILGPRTGQQHNALDFSVPVGTPVYAVVDSKVTRADNKDVWGGNIVQLTGTQSGNKVDAIYAHLSSWVVQPGQ